MYVLIKVVFPHPGGPDTQITGCFRIRSNKAKSRFLGKTPERMGRVTLLMIKQAPLQPCFVLNE
jgi:hypothetical protein